MTMTRTPSRYSSQEYVQPPHSACPGCAIPLAFRYVLKGVGGDVILVLPPSCSSVMGNYPRRIFKDEKRGNIAVLAMPLGSAAIGAGGLKTALVMRGDTHTTVIAWVGDGGTYDIGLSGVSAAAERNEDIIYVCCDNELYGNTGGQRSSATPWGAKTVTTLPPKHKIEFKKDIDTIIAAHSIPYLATATVAFPDDLIQKARKASISQGFRFLHILTPCVAGWGFRAESTIEMSRLAVDTGIFPLFEVENGKYTINRQPEGSPVADYVKKQGRYQHLKPEEISQLQQLVDEKWQRLAESVASSSRIEKREKTSD